MRMRASTVLLYSLLTVTAAANYTLWLVMVRCLFDGDSYQWGMRLGLTGLRGSGVGDDFWVLVLMTAFVLSLIHLGSRGARAPFAAMLIGWYAVHFYAATRLAIEHGSTWRFRGDTLGIDVRLDLVMPALYAGALAIAAAWLWLSRKPDEANMAASWTRRNLALLIAAAAILPVQFVLLRSGEPHGLTDQIGVLLTVAQWILVCTAISFPARLFDRQEPAAALQ